MLRCRSNWWPLVLVCAAVLQADVALAQAPRPPFPFGLNERYYGYRPRVYGYWPSAYVYPRYGYVRGTGYDMYNFPCPSGSSYTCQPYGAPPDWMTAETPIDGECLGETPADTATDAAPLQYPAP